MNIVSITDHDNTGAIAEAVEKARELKMELIPGTEFSSELMGLEVHINGYFFDYKDPAVLNYLKEFRKERVNRFIKIIHKLNEAGSNINVGEILKLYPDNVSLGRPHIAFAMVKDKFVTNYNEAFNKYIGDGKPCYIKKPNPSSSEIIKLITNAGGLSFVAHPGKYIDGNYLSELIRCGIDGIEIVHPSHTKEKTHYFSKIASENFMLVSGGSDFHGFGINEIRNLGNYFISAKEVENMKRRLF